MLSAKSQLNARLQIRSIIFKDVYHKMLRLIAKQLPISKKISNNKHWIYNHLQPSSNRLAFSNLLARLLREISNPRTENKQTGLPCFTE